MIRLRAPLFLFAFFAICFFALKAFAQAVTTPVPTDAGALLAFWNAGDWPDIIAVCLAGLSYLPRRLTGWHIVLPGKLGALETKLEGFWHSKKGVAILLALPPVVMALAEAIWKTHSIALKPILLALIGAVWAQLSPQPKKTDENTKTEGDIAGAAAALKAAAGGAAVAILFITTAFVGTLLGACGPTGQRIAVDIAACAIGQVPGVVSGLLPDVITALTGAATDWAAEEAKLIAQGVDVAICAIKAAIFDLEHQKATLVAKRSASPLSPTEDTRLVQINVALDRAHASLTKLGVK